MMSNIYDNIYMLKITISLILIFYNYLNYIIYTFYYILNSSIFI